MTRTKPTTRKWVLSGLIAASLALVSAQALAQDAAAAGGGNGVTGTGAAAGGFGPNDATIRVRPGPVRTTLIRPRTSFVPEMLKSVENI